VVTYVQPGSPAASGGLQIGDMISLVTMDEGNAVETGQGVPSIAAWDQVLSQSTTGKVPLTNPRGEKLFPPELVIVQLIPPSS
jgi:hypothetical protein